MIEKPDMAPPDEAPSSKQFEYRIDTIPLPVEDDLLVAHCDELGADGWELIQVTPENGLRLWFKREAKLGDK